MSDTRTFKIRILQHNCNRNIYAMHSCLQTAEKSADIVIIQEPKAPCPLQPHSKKKPHQIFRQAFFSLAENPSFPASPPLLQRKKSTTPRYNVFLSRERQEKVYLQSSDTSFRRNPVLSTPCR